MRAARSILTCLAALAGCGGGDDTDPGIDALPPSAITVTVEAPNGGEALVAAEPAEIRWTASDPAGRPLTYEVALVDGDGAARVIATDLPAGPLAWAPSGVAAPTAYRIRVTARAGEEAAADTSDAPFTVSPPATGTSLARDVQPIFTARCTTQFCHGTANQVARLHLAPGASHGALVGVPSATSACNAYTRVRPGEPDQSYLLWKLAGSGACFTGVRMPKNAPALSAADVAIIRAWIAEGARDN